MAHAKRVSKRKRRSKALPLLGAAGLSLSLASGASATTGGSAVDIPSRDTAPRQEITLIEVLHRALPDLQRMKLLLFCCRVVGTEVGILFGAIKPDL